ncbi:MAG: hypothetical protein KGJ84_11135 [Elusimicrobia bacterium]|nr:hypothetical protein [Elusimicrobiota bacterium]
MKRQIERLSPHQNGKVFGVLMAVSSLAFVVPMSLILMLVPTLPGQGRPPAFVFLLFPIMYLVMGYVMTAVGCLVYNFFFDYIGGIEFDVSAADGGAPQTPAPTSPGPA